MERKDEILARTRRRINAAKARQGKSWQDIFGKCDKDQSGYLDFNEFAQAVRTTLNVPENAICAYELRTLFNEMDKDRSGGVNIEELLVYLAQGPRTPEEIAARAQVRIQRVRKNLKTAFQTIGSNEMTIRKLFSKLDMDCDSSLSLYEFKSFVRMNLKLSFWDVCNTDIEDFYKYLDPNGNGMDVEELIAFVRTNNADRPKDFSFMETQVPVGAKKKCAKKKTYKQQLLEDSFRTTSLPDLTRVRSTPSMVSLGREFMATGRNTFK